MIINMSWVCRLGRTGFADDDCLYFIAAVEWICWLNGQRKKAPTPEVTHYLLP